jgi:hypothetical protein
MKKNLLLVSCFILFLNGCATAYQNGKGQFTGGWSVKNMEGDIYRVVFRANGYTTKETTQTYWLYKCSELAIEKGFDGFEILSNIALTQNISPETFFSSDKNFKPAQYYVPIYINNVYKPVIEADIKLIKLPFENKPPKIFEAKKLKDALNDYVNGKKCNSGNVCEHVHKYIYGEGSKL